MGASQQGDVLGIFWFGFGLFLIIFCIIKYFSLPFSKSVTFYSSHTLSLLFIVSTTKSLSV